MILRFAVGGLLFVACSEQSGVKGASVRTGDELGALSDEQLGCQLFESSNELTIRCREFQSDWGRPVFGEARADRVVVAGCQPAIEDDYTCSMKMPANLRRPYGTIGWQRTYRHFRVDSPTDGRPKLSFYKDQNRQAAPETRRGCFAAQERSLAVLSMSGLSQAQRESIPFFDCYSGGPGLWTVVVRQVEHESCSAGACLRVALEVVAVSLDGTRASFAGPIGTLMPGTNRLRWEVSDVDGDGLDDFVFAINAGDSVYDSSFSQATSAARGPIQVPWRFHYWRRIDGDGLADVETFGPYSRNLGEDCGLKHCPNLVHGPELLGHNTPFGFTFNDAVAYEYLASSCTDARQSGETPFQNLARRAVCARLLGAGQDQVVKDLALRRRKECIERDSCPAFDVLNEWLQGPVPPELESISDWSNQCRSPLL